MVELQANRKVYGGGRSRPLSGLKSWHMGVTMV